VKCFPAQRKTETQYRGTLYNKPETLCGGMPLGPRQKRPWTDDRAAATTRVVAPTFFLCLFVSLWFIQVRRRVFFYKTSKQHAAAVHCDNGRVNSNNAISNIPWDCTINTSHHSYSMKYSRTILICACFQT